MCMKKIFMLVAGIMILSISCSKSEKEAIDCAIELSFATIGHNANVDNPKEVTFTLQYVGSFTATITWEFGDGTSKTVVGTSATHVYSDAGNYEVKANVTLSHDDYSSCSTSKSKHVEVL